MSSSKVSAAFYFFTLRWDRANTNLQRVSAAPLHSFLPTRLINTGGNALTLGVGVPASSIIVVSCSVRQLTQREHNLVFYPFPNPQRRGVEPWASAMTPTPSWDSFLPCYSCCKDFWVSDLLVFDYMRLGGDISSLLRRPPRPQIVLYRNPNEEVNSASLFFSPPSAPLIHVDTLWSYLRPALRRCRRPFALLASPMYPSPTLHPWPAMAPPARLATQFRRRGRS